MHITNSPTKDDGQRAEPEEQTVSRILTTDAETNMTNGQRAGNMQAAVVVSSPVAQFARAMRANCVNCANFDNAAFLSFFQKADHPLAPRHLRESMNSIRAGLLQTQNASVGAMHSGQDGDMDVEHAIRVLGFCHALGEVMKEETIVHPLSSCPEDSITPTTPDGYFKPRDRASEKAGERAYDNIMLRASSKAP